MGSRQNLEQLQKGMVCQRADGAQTPHEGVQRYRGVRNSWEAGFARSLWHPDHRVAPARRVRAEGAQSGSGSCWPGNANSGAGLDTHCRPVQDNWSTAPARYRPDLGRHPILRRPGCGSASELATSTTQLGDGLGRAQRQCPTGKAAPSSMRV